MFETLQEAIDFGEKKTNDGGLPFFRMEAVEIPNSDPVEYEDTVFVKIINKGDPKSIMDRPKRPEDETRWPNYWNAFVEGSETPLNGIPIKEFPALTPADIATCHRYHIRTVEDLADYPDVQLTNIGSRGTSLKKKAKEFIEYRKGPDMQSLVDRIAQLEKQLGDDTGNVSKRAAGNGVSDDKHPNRKQQQGRKNNPKVSRKKRKSAS